jgi:hypothetical protein
VSGRRDLFQKNSGDADFLTRFDKIAADVKKGNLRLEDAAIALNCSTRTIERMIERRDHERKAQTTYEKIENFDKLPGINEFKSWVTSRHRLRPDIAKYCVNGVERIWTEVWKKKNPALLSESDFVDASNWVMQQSEGNRSTLMLAVRTVIRGGLGGKFEWLSKHLSTKGLKVIADMPVEFLQPDTFHQVIPRLYGALDELEGTMVKSVAGGANATLTRMEIDEFETIVDVKRSWGPRTGDSEAERETWGMKINSGRTNVAVDGDGHVQSIKFYAKGGYTWGPIPRAMLQYSRVTVEKLEKRIAEYSIVNDQLLWSMSRNRAYAILRAACQKAQMTNLRLHDFRKMYASAMIEAGVPMEIAVDLGVGWHDMNTMKKHYLALRGATHADGYAKIASFQGLN